MSSGSIILPGATTSTVISTSTSLLSIVNYPHVATYNTSASNLGVTFTDTSTDPNGTSLADTWTYAWNFGDGTATTTATTTTIGNNQSHTYANAGTYTVTLVITDQYGVVSTKISTVTASNPPLGGTGGSTSGGSYFTSSSVVYNPPVILPTPIVATTTSTIPNTSITEEIKLPTTKYFFVSYLKVGMSGEEVSALQQMLKDYGYFTFNRITGYYGPITQAAVVKFQYAYNLAPYPGVVGPLTRAMLNSLQGNVVATTTLQIFTPNIPIEIKKEPVKSTSPIIPINKTIKKPPVIDIKPDAGFIEGVNFIFHKIYKSIFDGK
jgi:PKD repeat protein